MNKHGTTAQDLLASGEEHFQQELQAGRVMFWAAGAGGACEVVSANWTEITGQPLNEARGDGWLQAIAEDDVPLVRDTVRRAIDERCGFYLRYRLKASSTPSRWVLHDASPRFLPSGRFTGLVGTLNDCGDLQDGEAALRTSAKKVYDYVDEVSLAAVAIDMSGRIVHSNAALATLFGSTTGLLNGGDWTSVRVAPEDRERVRALIAGAEPASDLPEDMEYSIVTARGTRLYRWHLTLVRDFDGRPLSLTMMGNDITQWRREGDSLRLNARVVETSNEAIVITDRNNRIVSVNASFTRLTGYSAAEVIGKNPRLLKSGRHDVEFYRQMWHDLLRQDYWRGDIWDRHKDGTIYPKFLAISVIRDPRGEIVNFSGIFHDVSARKALEDRLDRLAHFDELTDLPNRALLHDRLEQAIVASERLGQKFALLFIDLDGFKPINDRHGHATGDAILREVGNRLRGCVRGMDTAARLGGDEFVVILTDIQNRDTAAQVAEKIGHSIARPYAVDEHRIELSASIGVSLYPSDEMAAHELLRTADEAMYSAKRKGKRRVSFYNGSA